MHFHIIMQKDGYNTMNGPQGITQRSPSDILTTPCPERLAIEVLSDLEKVSSPISQWRILVHSEYTLTLLCSIRKVSAHLSLSKSRWSLDCMVIRRRRSRQQWTIRVYPVFSGVSFDAVVGLNIYDLAWYRGLDDSEMCAPGKSSGRCRSFLLAAIWCFKYLGNVLSSDYIRDESSIRCTFLRNRGSSFVQFFNFKLNSATNHEHFTDSLPKIVKNP